MFQGASSVPVVNLVDPSAAEGAEVPGSRRLAGPTPPWTGYGGCSRVANHYLMSEEAKTRWKSGDVKD